MEYSRVSCTGMAKLILSDGTEFEGESFGAPLDTRLDTPSSARLLGATRDDVLGEGEVVFNTGMAGYNESLTDPSYRGQILVFTYPLIGNYGVPSEELNEYGFSKNFESEDIHVRGVICTKVSEDFSHWNAEISFPDWLKKHGIPGITGVDTRALTSKLRETGVMLGRIVFDEDTEESQPSLSELRLAGEDSEDSEEVLKIEDPNLRNLVAEVSCKEVVIYDPKSGMSPLDASTVLSTGSRFGASAPRATRGDMPMSSPTIVAYDCGIKRNILRSFLKRGVKVIRVPWNFDLASADFKYDGVFISNGPGDPSHPEIMENTVKQVRWSIDQGIPTFGICLGNQLLALAIGGDTYKLKYGHRSVNQPCVEVESGKRKEENELSTLNFPLSTHCIITSQNHGFAVDGDKLPDGWSVWFTNGNDGTVEGIRHESGKFFSVQFHPEATPGPEDAGYLFDEFLEIIKIPCAS